MLVFARYSEAVSVLAIISLGCFVRFRYIVRIHMQCFMQPSFVLDLARPCVLNYLEQPLILDVRGRYDFREGHPAGHILCVSLASSLVHAIARSVWTLRCA